MLYYYSQASQLVNAIISTYPHLSKLGAPSPLSVSGAPLRATRILLHDSSKPAAWSITPAGWLCSQTAVVARPIRVLIAWPEEDIEMLYRQYLDLLSLDVTIVSTGDNCLESVFNTIESEGFDMILSWIHILKDISGIEVARRIKKVARPADNNYYYHSIYR